MLLRLYISVLLCEPCHIYVTHENIDKLLKGGENMGKEGETVAQQLRNDKELLLKLSTVGLIVTAANKKVSNYVQKHAQVFEEMREDEEAMQLFNLYYEENEQELREMAHESLFTSDEVEKLLSMWRDKEYGTEG